MNKKLEAININGKPFVPLDELDAHISQRLNEALSKHTSKAVVGDDVVASIVAGVLGAIEKQLPRVDREAEVVVASNKESLAKHCDELRVMLENHCQLTADKLRELRENRMAIVSELTMVSTPLRDLRKFFLDSDHSAEVHRLKEFLELCERLKKLRDDGFLDKIADTILKLS